MPASQKPLDSDSSLPSVKGGVRAQNVRTRPLLDQDHDVRGMAIYSSRVEIGDLSVSMWPRNACPETRWPNAIDMITALGSNKRIGVFVVPIEVRERGRDWTSWLRSLQKTRNTVFPARILIRVRSDESHAIERFEHLVHDINAFGLETCLDLVSHGATIERLLTQIDWDSVCLSLEERDFDWYTMRRSLSLVANRATLLARSKTPTIAVRSLLSRYPSLIEIDP
jgi:hypothetical protein